MTVESVTYISDLDKTYPAESETGTLHEGNDHLRNIKKALDGSFPNFTGAAVTATEAELNYVDVTTLGTMQASKALTANGSNVATVPSGGTLTAASGSTVNLDGTTAITGNITANSKTISPAELGTLDGITTTSTIAQQLAAISASIPSSTATFGIQFSLDVGADGNYVLDQYASFAYTVNSVVHQCDSGTISCAVQIDGTGITGLTALSLTSSESAVISSSGTTANKTVDAGDTLRLVLSSNSSAMKVRVKLNCTRT
jgi:hypothetical protein